MKYIIEGNINITGLDLRSKDEAEEIIVEIEEYFNGVSKDSGYDIQISFEASRIYG